MDRLIAEIRAAVDAGAVTLALQGTLACIDICAALASDDGCTTRTHFKAWFSAHLGAKYAWLSPDDAYKLRCGMLHQGRASSAQYSAILFTLPDGRGNVFHHNILNDALNLDLNQFCGDVLAAAELWWHDHKDTDPVRRNAESLVRVRPEGLAPYMVGMPILA